MNIIKFEDESLIMGLGKSGLDKLIIIYIVISYYNYLIAFFVATFRLASFNSAIPKKNS